MIDILKKELSKQIDIKLIEELMKEYVNVMEGFYSGDNQKVISHSGKFIEIIFAILDFLNSGKISNLNQIKVDMLYKKITNLPKPTGKEELLYLEIPRVARSIYTIRSKKRVSHVKDLDPILQDSFYVKSGIDWILSSLIYLYHTKSDSEIKNVIDSLIEKKVPFIEEFEDGGIMVLKKMGFKWKILLILYRENGLINKEKVRELSKPPYRQLFDTSLNDLQKAFLIYINNNQIKITKKGIEKVEKDLI